MKKVFSLLTVLGVALAAVLVVQAQPDRPGGRGKGFSFWNISKIAEKLELTDDQIDQLEEINYQFQKDSVAPRSRAASARIELDHLLEESSSADESLQNLVDQLAQSAAELERLNLQKKISMRRILNDDQWNRIKNMRRLLSGGMRNRGGQPGRSGGRRSGGGRGWRGDETSSETDGE